ncbi:hypothetical protein HDU67_006252 [Dinochytrium kinnereticum]|nr:hypothetical protein HDU67_006252 [Dinochytrium kinnereticum]
MFKSSVLAAGALTLLIALAPQAADAYFVLSSPLSRGFNEDKSTVAPCGDYNEFVNPVNLPKTTTISIASFDFTGNFTVGIGYPTGIMGLEFFPIAQGVVPQFILPQALPFNITAEIDLPKGPSGVIWSPDTPAIVQVVFESEGVTRYQCADVVVESSATLPPRDDQGIQSIPDLSPSSLPSTMTATTSTTMSSTTGVPTVAPTTTLPVATTSKQSSDAAAMSFTVGAALMAGLVAIFAVAV